MVWMEAPFFVIEARHACGILVSRVVLVVNVGRRKCFSHSDSDKVDSVAAGKYYHAPPGTSFYQMKQTPSCAGILPACNMPAVHMNSLKPVVPSLPLERVLR